MPVDGVEEGRPLERLFRHLFDSAQFEALGLSALSADDMMMVMAGELVIGGALAQIDLIDDARLLERRQIPVDRHLIDARSRELLVDMLGVDRTAAGRKDIENALSSGCILQTRIFKRF